MPPMTGSTGDAAFDLQLKIVQNNMKADRQLTVRNGEDTRVRDLVTRRIQSLVASHRQDVFG
jgi:hypothetical protein